MAVMHEPAEGALHHRTARQDFKSGGAVRALHDLGRQLRAEFLRKETQTRAIALADTIILVRPVQGHSAFRNGLQR